MADRVGQQLGNYRLIRLVGVGGFAEVYLGEHIHLGTEAAVKVLRVQLAKDEVDRFRDEAKRLAHLKHPRIVRVLDFDVDKDTPFLIMDYASHGTMRQRHPRGAVLQAKTVIPYVKQVAEALQFAYDTSRLIHRDIKPENMLLGPKDEILLSDFGIATIAQSSQAQGTQTIAGTVTYMSPEQIQGKPVAASDQYSLAVVAYEWFTGAPPFRGTFAEITTQHIHTPPTPLQKRVGDIPTAIEQVILRALEKTPANRYATIQAFAEALEQAYQSPQLSVHTIPATPAPSSSPRPQPVRVATAPPPSRPVGPSTVPALPKPGTSNVLWPTFSISIDERRAITSGLLPQEQLGMTGKLETTTPGPLPFVATPPQIAMSQVFPQNQGTQSLFTPPATHQPPVIHQGTGGMVIARSSGGIPNQQRQQSPQPTGPISGPTSGGIVRSSGSAPKPPVPVPTATRSTGRWRSGIALTLACVNILIVLYALSATLAVALWTPYTIYSLATLSFVLGVIALRKDSGRVRTVAGWSISLSVISVLVETVRLIYLLTHP